MVVVWLAASGGAAGAARGLGGVPVRHQRRRARRPAPRARQVRAQQVRADYIIILHTFNMCNLTNNCIGKSSLQIKKII